MAKKVTKTTQRVQSIIQKSIGAINKAESVVASIPKTIDTINSIKQEVDELKDNMDLGLRQYEQEILEKQTSLDEQFAERKVNLETDIETKRNEVEQLKSEFKREIETINYEHNLAFERKSIETANAIAKEYDKILVNKSYEAEMEQSYLDLREELTKEKESELSAKSRGHAIAENKLKSEFAQERIVLTTRLESAEKRVSDLESQIEYLKEQLEISRTTLVDSLKASKSDVTVNNDNTGKK